MASSSDLRVVADFLDILNGCDVSVTSAVIRLADSAGDPMGVVIVNDEDDFDFTPMVD